MAAERPEDVLIPLEGEEEDYIDPNDVYVEVTDDGDLQMDGDDEDQQLQEGPGEDIVYEDNSIHHFPDHKGSVFAVSSHPLAPLIASGGEDDLGYIWDYNTGEAIVKLTGHSDSVTSTAFSFDGELIATGGMDGKVRVWRRVGKEDWKKWEFLTELQGPDEVMWLKWHPKGSVLLAGSNDTTVWLWQLPSGNTMQVFAGHQGPVHCGAFTPDGKRIITADESGTLIYWDPRSPNPLFKTTPFGGDYVSESITSLAVNPPSTIAVVGGQEGGVKVVSLSKGEVVGSLEGHEAGSSVESIVFVDIGTGGVVVTGAVDGKACIFDLNTMRIRAVLEHEDTVTALLCLPPPKSHLLVSASADKTLRTWDARTGTLIREHKGHYGPVLGATLGLGGDVVVSAGDDGVCLVFRTQ